MWNDSRLSLAVYTLMFFGFTTFYLCCHSWFICSSDVLGGCGFYYCLFLKFLHWIQGENLAWSTAIVPVISVVEQNEDFRWRKYERPVQWYYYFSRVDVYLRMEQLLRSDIKQCCGGLNFIWTCQHIPRGTRLDSSHKHLCHRIKEITTVF